MTYGTNAAEVELDAAKSATRSVDDTLDLGAPTNAVPPRSGGALRAELKVNTPSWITDQGSGSNPAGPMITCFATAFGGFLAAPYLDLTQGNIQIVQQVGPDLRVRYFGRTAELDEEFAQVWGLIPAIPALTETKPNLLIGQARGISEVGDFYLEAEPAVQKTDIDESLEWARTDAKRAWDEANWEDDEELTKFRSEIREITLRHRTEGVRAISKSISFTELPGELEWAAIEVLAQIDDPRTFDARKQIIELALEANDPSIRFTAAECIGDLMGPDAKELLRRRLDQERNASVRAMIESYFQ